VLTGSPLGKYSQIVAAVVAILVIAAALFLHAFRVSVDPFIDNMALIAFGAIFGASASTAVTNGSIKRDVDALHKRIDAAGVPAAQSAGGSLG
jgi:4-hydroxybenzoate polyprenyltransferase